MNQTINGVIVIDKPMDMTSHDVVAIMRRKLKTKKIGHTGTLDPMATGVLPICIGKATKIVDFLMDQKKTYHCTMMLGTATDTQDRWGEVILSGDCTGINEKEITETILSFVGEIQQIPPMYSALKVNGEKLVDLARKGIVVEREARIRTIHSIENIDVRQHTASFLVTCSKGTYIRTLCHDIGIKLGCYAHMTELRRTASDPFKIESAMILEDLSLENIDNHIISIEDALDWMPLIILPRNAELLKQVENGVRKNLDRYVKEPEDVKDKFYRVFIEEQFYGLAERLDNGIYMKKLMIG
ncbi:MAG: tRNA pseudouridine(55) synthase TruB [Bacillota bacterium]|nr:tRNA pseudouridine(55) synthase TruB [Bacillota bacterium]